jgi:hypothetical protein
MGAFLGMCESPEIFSRAPEAHYLSKPAVFEFPPGVCPPPALLSFFPPAQPPEPHVSASMTTLRNSIALATTLEFVAIRVREWKSKGIEDALMRHSIAILSVACDRLAAELSAAYIPDVPQ